MTVGAADQDYLVPTSDLAQVSGRVTECLLSAGLQVVPAGQAVLRVAWRGRPRWAYVLGWLTLPLLGLGALLWMVRRTESSTITLMVERAGVRVHVTGMLPNAALTALHAGFAGAAGTDPSTSVASSTPPPPSAPASDVGLVAEVPGFARPQRVVPMPPEPELAASQTMTSQAVRQLRAQTTIAMTIDNGEVVVMAAFGLLGRNPSAEAGDPYAQLVAVPDSTRTVSKTHLAYGVEAGEIWVMDRHSTNGTTVVSADGHRTTCPPGFRTLVRPGQTVQFGDRTLVVHATG
jgi:hypothetical protein